MKWAKNKAATFAAGTSRVLDQIQPIFEKFLEQLRSVTTMATDALTSISQERGGTERGDLLEILLQFCEQVARIHNTSSRTFTVLMAQ